MNSSNISPSHVLHFFIICSSVGFLPWDAVLQEQSAPVWICHGVTIPASTPAPTLFPSPHILQGTCFSVDFPWEASFGLPPAPVWAPPWATDESLFHSGLPEATGAQLPHHDPHHGLQGKVCYSTWSTSFPAFTDPDACRVLSPTYSHSSLWLQLLLVFSPSQVHYSRGATTSQPVAGLSWYWYWLY